MGISIHYRGCIKNLECLQTLKRDLIRIAKESNWNYHDLSQKQDIVEIVLQIHPHCEFVFFLFDANGRLHNPAHTEYKPESEWCFVKTQDAPIEVHISLVRFLRYLQKNYLSDLEVIDEGGFWGNEDFNKLKANRDFIAEKMDLVTNALTEIKASTEWKDENSIGDLVEEAILKKAELERRKLN
jgi:hypothetical protein